MTKKEKVAARIARFRTGVLPLIAADPEHAFPTSIAKRFPREPGDTLASLQNTIGDILRIFQQEGIVTVEQVKNPDGGNMVRKYTLTEKGKRLLEEQLASAA